jgi:hypothetical protein
MSHCTYVMNRDPIYCDCPSCFVPDTIRLTYLRLHAMVCSLSRPSRTFRFFPFPSLCSFVEAGGSEVWIAGGEVGVETGDGVQIEGLASWTMLGSAQPLAFVDS